MKPRIFQKKKNRKQAAEKVRVILESFSEYMLGKDLKVNVP